MIRRLRAIASLLACPFSGSRRHELGSLRNHAVSFMIAMRAARIQLGRRADEELT